MRTSFIPEISLEIQYVRFYNYNAQVHRKISIRDNVRNILIC